MGNVKGTGLYLAKIGSDGITSCFVAMMTNLFFSYSLTHAEAGVDLIGSKPVSLCTCKPQTICSVRRKGKDSQPRLTHQ